MKIIALQGSPRVGGNCDVLMDEMIKGAEENGHEVVKHYLEKEDIASCKACLFCAENPDCVREDDGNKIINELVAADGVIFVQLLFTMVKCLDKQKPSLIVSMQSVKTQIKAYQVKQHLSSLKTNLKELTKIILN